MTTASRPSRMYPPRYVSRRTGTRKRGGVLRRALGVAAAAVGLLLAGGLASCSQVQGWVQDKKDEDTGIQLDRLVVPPGYRVSVLATGLPKARHMAVSPNGTLFVGSMAGNVYALTLRDGAVIMNRVLLTGLRDPSGVAFGNGALYVADRTRILRYDNIERQLDNPPRPVETITGLPEEKRHDAHAMAFGPDGKLYVSVGSPCDVCESVNDQYGTIIRVNADGSAKEVVARGIRNTVGFDWHPQTRDLWFTENGQDSLGPDRPNDELNKVLRTGEHFGFPYCHDRDIPDPKFTSRSCSEFSPPAFQLGAHVAALGMRFDAPATKGGETSMLVARHGSHPPIRVGYDVVRVVVQDSKAVRMEPFMTGFLQGQKFWGRPMDVLVMRDGSILVSDDLNGAIYRVTRPATALAQAAAKPARTALAQAVTKPARTALLK